MITKLITILQELDLGDNDFYKFIPEHTKIISDNLIDEFAIDLCGIYKNDSKEVSIRIPRLKDYYTTSIAIHEIGHLFDYYLKQKIVMNENTSLLFEFTYLYKVGELELLKNRIREIEKNKTSVKYKSLMDIKKETKQSLFRL